ncbi:conserved hypothetical protein [Ricinus communis]|uniref:Uncharacterized protein n=1 Tax=Ricinus communis TaxID=3988 RepID=B9RKB9_RICCO|nr:conserved hypothetical protein [Ricinus communis]
MSHLKGRKEDCALAVRSFLALYWPGNPRWQMTTEFADEAFCDLKKTRHPIARKDAEGRKRGRSGF